MLRPACLLPAARLSPTHGLLTPRSGTEVSLHYLGSTTRRTEACQDGTLTRWTGAAGSAMFASTAPSRRDGDAVAAELTVVVVLDHPAATRSGVGEQSHASRQRHHGAAWEWVGSGTLLSDTCCRSTKAALQPQCSEEPFALRPSSDRWSPREDNLTREYAVRLIPDRSRSPGSGNEH
jgi:hypothetical protein